MSLSQKNFYRLAQEKLDQNQVVEAIKLLEEGLSQGYDHKLAMLLCKLYLDTEEVDQAYSLIKEETDLFSDKKVYQLYLLILKHAHFYIEWLQIKALSGKLPDIAVEPVGEQEQLNIMNQFKQARNVTLGMYQDLFKLNLTNFVSFTQSLLLDPTLEFATRLTLLEDLVKLKLTQKISVKVLDKIEVFIPAETELLRKSPIYREVIYGIGDRYRNRPNELPYILGLVNLFIGTLYPKIPEYITNTASFTKNLLSYIETGNGYEDQEVLTKINKFLPK